MRAHEVRNVEVLVSGVGISILLGIELDEFMLYPGSPPLQWISPHRSSPVTPFLGVGYPVSDHVLVYQVSDGRPEMHHRFTILPSRFVTNGRKTGIVRGLQSEDERISVQGSLLSAKKMLEDNGPTEELFWMTRDGRNKMSVLHFTTVGKSDELPDFARFENRPAVLCQVNKMLALTSPSA